jgi:hypothetical protein
MNVEIGAEAALFPEKEYMNRIFVAVHPQQTLAKPSSNLRQLITHSPIWIILVMCCDEWHSHWPLPSSMSERYRIISTTFVR